MTIEEQQADARLAQAKDEIRQAFNLVDPPAKDPFAQAILKTLDSIDAASAALKGRAAGVEAVAALVESVP